MNAANITTKESDLKVIYGDYGKPTNPRTEMALTSFKYLCTDITDIKKYYIRLGFHLSEFKRMEYYREFGFLDFYEFCENNLGMDKGSVSRCINVFNDFNASNYTTYVNGVEKKGSAMEIGEQWKDFSYTQLCEMLPLNQEQRKSINPDMTIKDIREYKQSLKFADKSKSPVASTQPKKPFDKKKYDRTQGIVRQNVVRNCTAVNDSVVFNVFDKDGKFMYGNIWCELIYKSGHEYYFRLEQSIDTDNEKKTE